MDIWTGDTEALQTDWHPLKELLSSLSSIKVKLKGFQNPKWYQDVTEDSKRFRTQYYEFRTIPNTSDKIELELSRIQKNDTSLFETGLGHESTVAFYTNNGPGCRHLSPHIELTDDQSPEYKRSALCNNFHCDGSRKTIGEIILIFIVITNRDQM